MKDLDDFIFSLIRNPAFLEKVNDIEVECGNPLYQPVRDRYIAGGDVAFTEVRKVWRNTTQSMCGTSGFYEQLFPLVRAIKQKLPAGRRLRVLAGDPPIDWDQVKNFQDILRFGVNRDAHAASVMEKEVLAKTSQVSDAMRHNASHARPSRRSCYGPGLILHGVPVNAMAHREWRTALHGAALVRVTGHKQFFFWASFTAATSRDSISTYERGAGRVFGQVAQYVAR